MSEGLAKRGRVDKREGNRSKMNDYCNGLGYSGVTDECIRKGKKSESKAVRKMATSAMSAKNWNKGS